MIFGSNKKRSGGVRKQRRPQLKPTQMTCLLGLLGSPRLHEEDIELCWRLDMVGYGWIIWCMLIHVNDYTCRMIRYCNWWINCGLCCVQYASMYSVYALINTCKCMCGYYYYTYMDTYPSFESSTSQNCRQTKVEVHQPAVAATVTSRAAEVFKSAWNIWNILESQTITMFVAEDVVSLQTIVFFCRCFSVQHNFVCMRMFLLQMMFVLSNHHRCFCVRTFFAFKPSSCFLQRMCFPFRPSPFFWVGSGVVCSLKDSYPSNKLTQLLKMAHS